MRQTLRLNIFTSRLRLATPSGTAIGNSNPLRPAPLALLPPIPLYRRLFRAHRNRLDPEARVLGDQYIKAEFRAHQRIDNPLHIVGFLTEWQLYAQKLEGDSWKDERMEAGKVEKMSDEQINQLYELMRAIQRENENN